VIVKGNNEGFCLFFPHLNWTFTLYVNGCNVAVLLNKENRWIQLCTFWYFSEIPREIDRCWQIISFNCLPNFRKCLFFYRKHSKFEKVIK
jgi:hypothetical protein